MNDDNVHYPNWPVRPGRTGGGGPGDQDVSQRVAALEADIKDVKSSLARIETTLGRIDERTQQAATKTDLATLGGRVDSLGTRLDSTERTVGTALSTAIGKAIGPWQLIGVLAGAAGVFGAFATAFRWLVHQPWFAG